MFIPGVRRERERERERKREREREREKERKNPLVQAQQRGVPSLGHCLPGGDDARQRDDPFAVRL